MSSCASTAATCAFSARLAHGSRRPSTRAISTHSRTVTGKLQLIVSTCGTYAIRRPGRRVTLPRATRMLPASTRSAVVLPAPEGPTMPTNSPRWTARSTSTRTASRP